MSPSDCCPSEQLNKETEELMSMSIEETGVETLHECSLDEQQCASHYFLKAPKTNIDLLSIKKQVIDWKFIPQVKL